METFWRLFSRGLSDLALRPLPSFLTIAAVAMAVFLGGLFSLFVHNLDAEVGKRQGTVQFQVYWRPSAELGAVRGQWEELKRLDGLTGFTGFTPEQALEALQDSLSGAMDFSWLKGSSPLPPTALLQFGAGGESFSKDMFARLKAMPGVERVTFSPQRLDMAGAWGAVSRSLLWPMAGFLIFIVALVVGYTIRLSLLGRKSEVEVMRLVGARDWYIRLPLAVSGAVMGLSGAALALLLLKSAQVFLADILYYPPLWVRIEFFSLWRALSICAAATLVSLVSSWLAARD